MFSQYDTQNHFVHYQLNLNDEAAINLNQFIGQKITLRFTGNIHCIYSGKKIKKTYNQGYSYPAFIQLARNDLCIVKPERCHYHLNTCREPQWGEKHCFQKHTLYIAQHSHMKVGITRSHQEHTRWIDQGALWAKPIAYFQNRFQVGQAEYHLSHKLKFKDKANWRANLKGDIFLGDKDKFEQEIRQALKQYQELNQLPIEYTQEKPLKFIYPVEKYTEKPKSIKLDKTPSISKKLLGIRGQYLLFENDEVLNIRAHGGYEIQFEHSQ